MNLPQERNEQQVNQSPGGAMKWRANTCLCCFPTLEQVTKTPVKYWVLNSGGKYPSQITAAPWGSQTQDVQGFELKTRLNTLMKYKFSSTENFLKNIKSCLQDANRPQQVKWKVENSMNLVKLSSLAYEKQQNWGNIKSFFAISGKTREEVDEVITHDTAEQSQFWTRVQPHGFVAAWSCHKISLRLLDLFHREQTVLIKHLAEELRISHRGINSQ